MAVEVPRAVFDGIEAVRESGRTNMLDYYMVIRLAADLGYHETADWMLSNKRLCGEGLLAGFVVKDEEEASS